MRCMAQQFLKHIAPAHVYVYMRDICIACTFLLLLCPCTAEKKAASYTLEDIVAPQYYEQLVTQRRIVCVHEALQNELELVPKSLYAERAHKNRVAHTDGYIIECLYLVDKSELVKNSTTGETVDTSIDAVSQIVRSISKMEGMTYVSPATGTTRILYKRTYVMADMHDSTPVPDKTAGSADGIVLYVYQHDRLLGGCTYQINYYQSDTEIYMTFLNLTKMSFGIIKAVDEKQFRANMIIIDCGKQYLIYVGGEAGRKRIPLISNGINDAFYCRLNALYAWFIKQF